MPLKVNTGAVAEGVVCVMEVTVPVPPSTRAVQIVLAVGSAFGKVSVIVGFAPVVACAVTVKR